MFEFVYDELSNSQKDAYLARIGLPGEHSVTKQTLDKLVYAHQCTVPFESLDLYNGAESVPLDSDSLYRKIVERRRGGFCFELNGAFVMLLRAMGFDAYSVMCRVAARREVLGDISHRATIVRLNGKRYICDVGLGGPMAPFAVELSSERQTEYGETFWVESTYEGWFLLRRLCSDGSTGQSIVFAPQPFLQKDFIPLCANLTAKPDSGFRKNRMVNLRTSDGSISLGGNKLTICSGGETREEILEEDSVPQILNSLFGIIL